MTLWRRLFYHPEVNYALRQTLVLCLPVGLCWLFGNLQMGLLFSLCPACCNVAGLDTPHKRFFKRLIIGGFYTKFTDRQCTGNDFICIFNMDRRSNEVGRPPFYI